MFVPPPNGITHRVGLQHRLQDGLDLGLGPRADDGVGQAPEVPAAVAHEVAQALAARVLDAVERVGRDLADGLLERSAQRAAELGSGTSSASKATGLDAAAADVEPEVALA